MFKVIETTLTSALATAGTITPGYPSGYTEGDFILGRKHVITVDDGAVYYAPDDFTITLGDSTFTVTWKNSATIASGSKLKIQLDIPGDDAGFRVVVDDDQDDQAADMSVSHLDTVAKMTTVLVNLGTAATADPDGVCQSQSGAAGALTLNGALVSGGVATFDVPRNVVVDSGGADTATLTITGTDAYGNAIVEEITLNGLTAVPGKKAFKTVTSVVSDATISNGAFVGTGDILGLPIYLHSNAFVLDHLEDGASATAGTLVAGLNGKSTATTADVRGTVSPNSAPNGSIAFSLVIVTPDPEYTGPAQYAG